jgi:hypothetical protein
MSLRNIVLPPNIAAPFPLKDKEAKSFGFIGFNKLRSEPNNLKTCGHSPYHS